MERKVCKDNLNKVLLTTTRLRSNNKLFDKFAYMTRGQRFLDMSYEGLSVDNLGIVAFQPFFSAKQQMMNLEIDLNIALRKEPQAGTTEPGSSNFLVDTIRKVQSSRNAINKRLNQI